MTAAGPEPRSADLIQAPGTPEAAWRSWERWAHFPTFPLPSAGRVVVLAAHPDDEVLGMGGTLARLVAAGVELTVVTVTDGERSHPDSRRVTPVQLAELRARELHRALSALGADRTAPVRLGLPDTGVARHEHELTRRLLPLLRGAVLCLAPWEEDRHGDHEAVGRAAGAAAAATAVPRAQYPVWMWHWARPGDPRVPWERAARIALPPPVREAKAAAVRCFTSQITDLGPDPADAAVLPPEELAHHLRDTELVLR
ncbi:PIG-L deacetylase family protein [Streptomyces bohaiensis]|uniref:PIG-L family deacetylase n=1 Tax=Streptomyces bohaiensis TaxID=1431344 RepID=A0ABX1CI19_9ACTN|nr:PIG-L family deacetylase [Streptomyces bohaiensis]NJQ17563.1 PIG-L family deacetylase [Streptomyces bohaiensis]